MSADTYSIYVENNKVADNLPLTYALILIKAIYVEFYNEKNLKVIIKRNLADEEIEDD